MRGCRSTKNLEVLALVGLCLSLYAVYVEHQNEVDASYEATCDINQFISCSKVFTSEWGHVLSAVGILPKGHLLDFPNAALGTVYFLIVFLHRFLPLASYKAKAGTVFAITVPVVVSSVGIM
ncbi:unnamed protein product, partial [Choristocarpus tenellus]